MMVKIIRLCIWLAAWL